jgi:predicted Rossmann fold flavoprotein
MSDVARLVVAGGGAAGLCCAAVAGRLGVRALVLERTDQPGRKLALAGGRKGNFTHTESPRQMVERYDCDAGWLLPLLRRVPYQRVVKLFHDLGVDARTDEDGCVWPVRTNAAGLREALVREAVRGGGTVRTGARVVAIECEARSQSAEGRAQSGGAWRVALESGESVHAENVLLATGGASYPQTGSSGDGIVLAQKAGLATVPWFPALASLRLREDLGVLAGISQPLVAMTLEVAGRAVRHGRGHFIFAHEYVSGSSVLNICGYAARALTRGQPVELVVDWVPGVSRDALADELLQGRHGHPRQLLVTYVSRRVSRRLAEVLAVKSGIPAGRLMTELSRAEAAGVAQELKEARFGIVGTEPMERATATGGGVRLDEVANTTMEARRRPGLYLAGEVLDIWGETGGYNLHFAWASGIAAAEAVSGCRL